MCRDGRTGRRSCASGTGPDRHRATARRSRRPLTRSRQQPAWPEAGADRDHPRRLRCCQRPDRRRVGTRVVAAAARRTRAPAARAVVAAAMATAAPAGERLAWTSTVTRRSGAAAAAAGSARALATIVTLGNPADSTAAANADRQHRTGAEGPDRRHKLAHLGRGAAARRHEQQRGVRPAGDASCRNHVALGWRRSPRLLTGRPTAAAAPSRY